MALVFLVYAVGAYFMLRGDERSWISVIVAIAIGLGIFISDVDFSTDLGIQW